MTKNDWYEAGDQIKKLVQDAVESQDFTQLSSTITKVVDQTVNGLQSALKEGLNGQSGTSSGAGGTQNRTASQYTRDRYQYSNSEAAEKIRQRMQEKLQNSSQSKDRVQKPVAVKVRVPGEIAGKVMKYYGYSVSGMLGLAFGIVVLVGIATGFNMFLPASILAFLFGAHFAVGQNGNERIEMANRFRKYLNVLGDRTYCLVEELAGAIGKSSKFVRRDLKKMIGKGYFKEGFLDEKKTLLITDRSTYQQYLTTQTEYVRRNLAQEEARKAEQRKDDQKKEDQTVQPKPEQRDRRNLSAECRELIAEGERYIQYIHECNDRIPGEEMSEKLDRLELVVTRIFREVEKDPSIVSDLKKMMSYYLPTMKKLLDAYCEMDAQPIRGQNIEKTKKEIEAAIDTINAAFENLLDSFFEEKAWDISSDISVLNTMLAQEGLKGQDFKL